MLMIGSSVRARKMENRDRRTPDSIYWITPIRAGY